MRYGNGQYFIYQPDTNYMQIPSTCIANVIVYYRDNLLIWAVAICKSVEIPKNNTKNFSIHPVEYLYSGIISDKKSLFNFSI